MILLHDENSLPFNKRFYYHGAVGKINFIYKINCPYIEYSTHQCARFSEYTRESHGASIDFLLPGRNQKQLNYFRSQEKKILEVIADTDFCGDCHKPTPPKYFITMKSRTGYAMMYVV